MLKQTVGLFDFSVCEDRTFFDVDVWSNEVPHTSIASSPLLSWNKPTSVLHAFLAPPSLCHSASMLCPHRLGLLPDEEFLASFCVLRSSRTAGSSNSWGCGYPAAVKPVGMGDGSLDLGKARRGGGRGFIGC